MGNGNSTSEKDLMKIIKSPEDIDHNQLELLLTKIDLDKNYEKKCSYTTFLIEAVRYRKVEIVTLLLKLGADVNKPDRNGFTPLIFISWGSLGPNKNETKTLLIFKLLIEYGAKVNILTKNNTNTLIEACWNIKTDITSEIIKTLLDCGSDVNQVDISGYSAASRAIEWFNYKYSAEIIKLLIAGGADVSGCLTPILNKYSTLKPDIYQQFNIVAGEPSPKQLAAYQKALHENGIILQVLAMIIEKMESIETDIITQIKSQCQYESDPILELLKINKI